jgi:hypothetical protein
MQPRQSTERDQVVECLRYFPRSHAKKFGERLDRDREGLSGFCLVMCAQSCEQGEG